MYLYTSPTTTDNWYRPLLSILAWPWHISSTWLLIFVVWFCCSGLSSSHSFVFFDLVTTLTEQKKKKKKGDEKFYAASAIYKYIWQFQILEDITCIIQLSHTEKTNKQDKPRKEKKIFEISVTIDWKCSLFLYTLLLLSIRVSSSSSSDRRELCVDIQNMSIVYFPFSNVVHKRFLFSFYLYAPCARCSGLTWPSRKTRRNENK